MHTQGPTINKTLQAINKLFYDHLECLSVIKACWTKLQHVALLEVGGAPAKGGFAAAEMHYFMTCVSPEFLRNHLSLKMCNFAIGHTRAHEEAFHLALSRLSLLRHGPSIQGHRFSGRAYRGVGRFILP